LYSYFYRLANGRINRSTFVTGVLLYILVGYIVVTQGHPTDNTITVTQSPNPHLTLVGYLVDYAIGIALLAVPVIFLLSLIARRLHDIGSNNLEMYPGLLNPFIFNIRDVFKKGDLRENKYGKPPKSGIDVKGLFGF
jgi:uncharacterized membrane protein YhaH (DUF805 family)